MKTCFSAAKVSLSEFKRNPAAVLRDAATGPVAVLEGSRVAFYPLEPSLFEAVLDELADQGLYQTAVNRLASKSRAVEVGLDELEG